MFIFLLFLEFPKKKDYTAPVVKFMASVMGGSNDSGKQYFGEMKMKTYYYRFWIPFVATKKKILILSIVSFMALC